MSTYLYKAKVNGTECKITGITPTRVYYYETLSRAEHVEDRQEFQRRVRNGDIAVWKSR